MRYRYTFKNLTNCEQKILEELNWNTLIQVPFHYLNLFVSAGILFTDDKVEGSNRKIVHHLNEKADEEDIKF